MHIRRVLAQSLVILCTLNSIGLSAVFNFANRDARIRLQDATAQLVVNTAITGFTGTLDITDPVPTKLTGSQTITFSVGGLERSGGRAVFSGIFDPTAGDQVTMSGTTRLQVNPGTTFSNVTVSGSDNLISGSPKFSQSITLTDSNSQLRFAIQNKLNNNVVLNGGQIRLEDTLHLADGVTLQGEGTIDVNMQTLRFPGKDQLITGTYHFVNATDVVINSRTGLSSTWYFGPDNGTSVLQGNGNTLDLSTGGTLWVQGGHGLELTDITVKGISQTMGTILMVDKNSTVSLSNATIQLSGNYTVTQGSYYFYGTNSSIVTGPYTLTFAQNGTMTVDRVTVQYDPLSTPDIHNVQPFVPDNINMTVLNNGRVVSYAVSQADMIIDTATYTLLSNHDLSSSALLNFRGNSATVMTMDGQYYSLNMNRAASGAISVAAGKVALLKNVVLKDFDPAHVSLGSGAAIWFGDNVTIELAKDIDLAVTWTFSGNATINAQGNAINFANPGGIVVVDNKTLTLANAKLENMQDNGNMRQLALYGSLAKVVLENTNMYLDGTVTLTQGSIDIKGLAGVYGNGKTFVHKSSGNVTIKKNSTLYCDMGVTYSYDTTAASGGHSSLVFSDALSSILHLHGATLHSTHTGLRLTTGHLVVQDRVAIESEGSNNAEALQLSSGVQIDILAGSTFDVKGLVIYQ